MSTFLTDGLLEQAISALQQGQLVAFPTETVYGLGADASNVDALHRLYTTKGRPQQHPVIVHLHSVQQLPAWVQVPVPYCVAALAEAFWPGPLTLLLPKATSVLNAVTGGKPTVGLRCPKHPVALALLAAFQANGGNGGLAAPSANKFGKISPTTAAHVRADFTETEVPLILEGGACQVGVESTILDLSVPQQPRLLRPGAITAEALQAVLGVPVASILKAVDSVEDSVAPGTLSSHYAPNAKVRLMPFGQLMPKLATLNQQHLKQLAVLSFTSAPPVMEAPASRFTFWQETPLNPQAYGQGLYAWLRLADASQPDTIYIELPPKAEEAHWQAVLDRLSRAAAGSYSSRSA